MLYARLAVAGVFSEPLSTSLYCHSASSPPCTCEPDIHVVRKSQNKSNLSPAVYLKRSPIERGTEPALCVKQRKLGITQRNGW
jgi:hypothetical protein